MSEDWSLEAPLPTRIADRYEIKEMIGSGGVARVYRAVDTRLPDRPTAVKLYLAPLLDKNRIASRFLAEARLMATMRHPHVVEVYDVGKEQGYYWYAMPLVSGGTLAEYIERHGPLPVEHAITWITELLDALTIVHGAGIVHRDVKPKNVVIDDRGRVRLLDFGLAHHPRGSVPYETAANMSMGSAYWAAPEQLQDAASVTPAADVYGVGCALGFMLTGRRPPDLLPDLMERRPDLGIEPALREVLVCATAWEADERYPDAATMAGALEPWQPSVVQQVLDWFRGW